MRDLPIAYGNSCETKIWSNKTISFGALEDRLKTTIRTPESAEEYRRYTRGQKQLAKDHGGFVGGILEGGRRLASTVASRSMIALDGDYIGREFLDGFEDLSPYTSCFYTTHSHVPDDPRIRIIFPLLRDVTPEEFVAVARFLAKDIGIDYFDACSFKPNQLMYWPSTPSNGEFIFKDVKKGWLDPDEFLSRHPEWKDPARLPTSSRESKANTVAFKKVQDPLEKSGVVGLFNRTYYPVTAALDELLPDVYEPTDNPNRYHLIESSSLPGVEVKEDGKFVYSHHAKDPAYLQLCNAFDIVRVHLFGQEDEKQSYKDMTEFALSLGKVNQKALEEKQEQALTDFGESADVDSSEWTNRLERDKRGAILNNLHNIRLIMENDPALKGIVFNQLADGLEVQGDVPWKHPVKFWRDADDAQLICYIDSHYGTFSQRNYEVGVQKVADDRSYHPIRQYLENLPEWDGIDRAETYFIDYLGAGDNPYVRAVTKKVLCAAYRRVCHPGTKFDYCVVLNGPQGIGKSTVISRLGMQWYSDSLALSDMNDKTAAEKLQGYWILEIGELAGMKKADIDKVKAFISRQDDKYRATFGRRVTPHPRQCVFIGTTNSETGFLRDITGNRRFWTVKVSGEGEHKPWEITQETVDQIWAEIRTYAEKEELFLPAEIESYAREVQREAMEQDDREGLVREYLDTLIPEGWEMMDLYKRRTYLRNEEDPTMPEGKILRENVCNMEIWCECFGRSQADLRPMDSYFIASIMTRIKEWKKTGKFGRSKLYGRQRIYERKHGK